MYFPNSYPEDTQQNAHQSDHSSGITVHHHHYHSHYVLQSDHCPVELVSHPHYVLTHHVQTNEQHLHNSNTNHPYSHQHHTYAPTHHSHTHYANIHHANPTSDQVRLPAQSHQDHAWHHPEHSGHTLHFKKIIATSDTSKIHWVWHISNHRKEVIKTSEHIHRSFGACLKDARHYDSKIIIEHDDIEKTSWVWVITDHHDLLIKKSTRIHATYIKCVEDLHQQNKAH